MGANSSRNARNCNVCCREAASDETSSLMDAGLSPFRSEHEVAPRAGDTQSVTQFASEVFFCGEEEGEVSVEIIRLGDTSGETSVDYRTEDATAKAGRKYVASEGRIHFGVGECHKVLKIKILQDEIWDAALEFGVHLFNVRGSTLGIYLKGCRVTIIDDDCFPTNKYKDVFDRAQSVEDVDVPSMSLMAEYVKLTFANSEICVKTVKSMLLDQVNNVYFFLTIYLQMYLIDVVLAPKEGEGQEGKAEGSEGATERRLLLQTITTAARFLAEASEGGEEGEASEGLLSNELIVHNSRSYTALVVGLLYILPFVLLHFIDNEKIKYGVAGVARRSLQANLLRKFLNYKEEKRLSISTGDITMAMVRDCKEVVDFGFMKVIEVVRIVGKLMLALVFILAENKMAIIPLLTYPFIMGIFLCLREARTIRYNEEMAETENSVVMAVNDAVKNYRLVADFDLRSFIVAHYEAQIMAFNKCEIDANLVNSNNRYLPPWLITFLIGGYFIMSTRVVRTCGGSLPLGAFVATINVFKEIGLELTEIYVELMEIQKSSGPLKKVCHYMNQETNLDQRMMVSRMRLATCDKMRQMKISARSSSSTSKDATFRSSGPSWADQVQIEISNVRFTYPSQRTSCFKKSLEGKFDQGKIYAFVGPPGQGKSTLMRLLGQVIHVDEEHERSHGRVFIPSHLRVLHLSQDTYLLHDSLLTNLVFNQEPEVYGGVDRVHAICAKLRFSPQIREHLEVMDTESGMKDTSWIGALSHTDMTRLSLARAFIMNPEFMVLQKPALPFDEKERAMIMSCIREHVDERGLDMSPDLMQLRAPRTVCYTSSSLACINVADVVYEVSAVGLEVVDKDTLADNADWLSASKALRRDLGQGDRALPSTGNGK